MKRILLTGMSGTGKSSVVAELIAQGYKAIDTDDGWVEPLPEGRQKWREEAIDALLKQEDTDVLFVAGCEENQVEFHDRFDFIVLLSAPLETLTERVLTRTNNPFGKSAEEFERFVSDIETIEPLLRRVATHEVVTTVPVKEVVATLLRLVDA